MSPTCAACLGPRDEGRHDLAASESDAYPGTLCPKCSGECRVTCVVRGRAMYLCSCGVRVSEALP